jgi:hypothetical protein
VCGYGWGMDWILALLTTCTHHSKLQITTAPAEPFSSLLYVQQPIPSNGFQQWRFFSFLCSCCYCLANVPQLNCLTHQPTTSVHSAELVNIIIFKITPWHGQHWKPHFSIVVHMFISAGMCLPSCCLETDCITPLFGCCMCYLATATVYRVSA